MPAALLDEERVARRRPLNLAAEDEHLFSHEFVRDFPAVQAIRASIVLVYGTLLIPIWGQMEEHVVYASPLRQLGKCARILVRGWRNPMVARGDLWVADRWSGGYFHWVCDVLPKLELLAGMIPRPGVIAPSTSRMLPTVIEAFRAFRLPIRHSAEYGVLLNAVYLPPLSPTGNPRPHMMRRLRDRFVKAPVRPQRRLYATRGPAARGIENEHEVMAELASHGFERIDWSLLSFAEQVRLASECAVLIGPHGANLTNCLFMPEGSLLIELRAIGDAHNNCYFALADCVGVNYGYSLHRVADSGRFVVDLPALRRDMGLLLGLVAHA